MLRLLRVRCFLKSATFPKSGEPFRNVRFLSYFHQCGGTALMYKTIGQLLDETAERFGDRTACVSFYQNQRVSFSEVKKKADDLAAGVLAHGIQKGDRVAIWAPNSLEWYIASFALAKAGVVSVYLNPAYQATEVQHCLNAVGVKMLFVADKFKSQNYLKILSRVMPELATYKPGEIQSSIVPTLKWVVYMSDAETPGTIPYKTVAEGATEESREKLKALQEHISPDDACNIQFTSGTTGVPKGVVLSHFHVVNNSHLTSKRMEFSQQSYIMCFMGPLFHAMGSVIAVLTSMHEGITLVLPEKSFSPTNAVKAILEEKCSILLGTPTMYVDLVKLMHEKGLKANADIAMSGGAYAPVQLVHDICDILGVKRFAAIYGMTETGPITFLSKPTDSREKTATTVGYIMEHTEAKVVDEKGRPVPWNTPGELWVRGYNIMKGYWGLEAKTKETVTEDNWLKTGDQFTLSSDGYGKIVGRIKDMILRGGENIYPAEIEDFLTTHPDVIDAQVIGVPDKRLGEKVCACILLKPSATMTLEQLREFCSGKIADFKIPEYIFIVEKFPKTQSGKIQKFKLRQMAMEHLNLKDEK